MNTQSLYFAIFTFLMIPFASMQAYGQTGHQAPAVSSMRHSVTSLTVDNQIRIESQITVSDCSELNIGSVVLKDSSGDDADCNSNASHQQANVDKSIQPIVQIPSQATESRLIDDGPLVGFDNNELDKDEVDEIDAQIAELLDEKEEIQEWIRTRDQSGQGRVRRDKAGKEAEERIKQIDFEIARLNEIKANEGTFVERSKASDDSFSPERKKELIGIRDLLVYQHGQVPPGSNAAYPLQLTHSDVGRLLLELDSLDLTDEEKAFVWNQFAADKGKEDSEYYITHEGADPKVINNGITGSDTTNKHTVLPFHDGYHGPLVDETLDGAEDAIVKKERNRTTKSGIKATIGSLLVLNGITNEEDINASVRVVQVMQDYDKSGDFTDFAEGWNEQFLDNGDDSRYDYDRDYNK